MGKPVDKLISLDEARAFLTEWYNSGVSVEKVDAGKHSAAFVYTVKGKQYVVRFNETDFGFKKDAYVYEQYGEILPIPQVHTIGTYNGTYYAISDYIAGHTVRDEYNENNFSSLDMQFETIETIARFYSPDTARGYGEWNPDTFIAPHASLSEYITAMYETTQYFDWEQLKATKGFDSAFFDYLDEKIATLIPYAEGVHELLHGDIGNDNIIIQDDQCAGILDWHKSAYGDHFFDVGRVILYCPDRAVTSEVALAFYEQKEHEYYKERMMLGVYFTMLTNYGAAARAGNIASLNSSPARIQEIEEQVWL